MEVRTTRNDDNDLLFHSFGNHDTLALNHHNSARPPNNNNNNKPGPSTEEVVLPSVASSSHRACTGWEGRQQLPLCPSLSLPPSPLPPSLLLLLPSSPWWLLWLSFLQLGFGLPSLSTSCFEARNSSSAETTACGGWLEVSDAMVDDADDDDDDPAFPPLSSKDAPPPTAIRSPPWTVIPLFSTLKATNETAARARIYSSADRADSPCTREKRLKIIVFRNLPRMLN